MNLETTKPGGNSRRTNKEQLAEAIRLLHKLNRKVQAIMASQQEAADKLDKITQNLTEIGTEVDTLLQRIQDLQNAAQGNVPDAIMDKINAVATQAQVVDDKVPNPAPPPTPGP